MNRSGKPAVCCFSRSVLFTADTIYSFDAISFTYSNILKVYSFCLYFHRCCFWQNLIIAMHTLWSVPIENETKDLFARILSVPGRVVDKHIAYAASLNVI